MPARDQMLRTVRRTLDEFINKGNGAVLDEAQLVVELLFPAAFLFSYWLVLKAIARVTNDRHGCDGKLGRAVAYGALWATIYTLTQWIGRRPENDLALFDALRKRYSADDARNIIDLLHGFSEEDAARILETDVPTLRSLVEESGR